VRFVAVTYGTEGDTRPLATLCRALMDAGHTAQLLAAAGTLGVAHTLGVPFTALSGDIAGRFEQAGPVSEFVQKGGGVATTATALSRMANVHAEAWMSAVMAAAEGCDALIVSGLAAFVGFSVAERLDVRAIGAGLIPITPTRVFPSPFLQPGLVPSVLNSPSHPLVNWLVWRAFRKASNDARASVCGLPARPSGWTDHPMLYGISSALVPRLADWPANARICVQWVPPLQAWTAPEALVQFLGAGEPPIYVGFGSMAGFDQPRTLEAIVGGVAGRRALFYPGWSGVDASALPDNIFVVGDTPHSWLFPRTAMIVHHGGSGTSHSAARAGVPSVVAPFAGDQFFWAGRLNDNGVAPAAVPAKTLGAAALSKAIGFAERDEVRLRARALGQAMASDDGLDAAVMAIEQLMKP
jgi:sterol 3beta-glucosyltransferase